MEAGIIVYSVGDLNKKTYLLHIIYVNTNTLESCAHLISISITPNWGVLFCDVYILTLL